MALRLLGAQEQVGSVSVTAIHNAPVKRWQYETTHRRLFPPAADAQRPSAGATEVKPVGDAASLVVHLLTEYLLIELYRAVVESTISEQLARIATMHRAADNARRLLDELTRDYNLARHHAETNALLEILTGYQATTEALPRI